ncbi:MAG: hypothetical protein GOVbin1807_140 [Prokaryotic dsDNA virus sp.]|nr:MAG: hypothetical protein GOVbin1807_140 [Prokaryotic dsDNA virus sp.]|tara:strand:- start:18743 stop:19867 length:1125 start_codon:yes stop_codon:yes gene_type:complete
MSNPDLRGYGSGRGTEVHNDPEAHYRKNLEEAKEVVNRDRLYTDITQCDAVVISDRGGEYGGTTDREIETDQSGTTKYISVIIRFIGPPDNPTRHPDQHKKDPLSAKNKEEFLKLRSLNATRAVKEPMLYGWFGEPEIGSIVRCTKRDNIWEIDFAYNRSHQPYDDFVKRMENPTEGSGKAAFASAGSNGAGAPGSSNNSPASSPAVVKFESDLQTKITGMGLKFKVTDRSRTVEMQMERIKNKFYNNGPQEVISSYGKNRGAAMVKAIQSADDEALKKLAAKSSKHLKGAAIDIRSWHYTDSEIPIVLDTIRELGGDPLLENTEGCWTNSGKGVTTTQRISGAKAGGSGRNTPCHNEHIHIDIPEDYDTKLES